MQLNNPETSASGFIIFLIGRKLWRAQYLILTADSFVLMPDAVAAWFLCGRRPQHRVRAMSNHYHPHDHPHDHSHGHTHGIVDPSIATSGRGCGNQMVVRRSRRQAILSWWWSSFPATCAVADTINNCGDAATAIPLGLPFGSLARSRASGSLSAIGASRPGRARDRLTIFASAMIAGISEHRAASASQGHILSGRGDSGLDHRLSRQRGCRHLPRFASAGGSTARR